MGWVCDISFSELHYEGGYGMGPSAAELSIKHIGILLAAYMILLNSLGVRQTSRQTLLGGAAA